jgi:hypothetical protein
MLVLLLIGIVAAAFADVRLVNRGVFVHQHTVRL